jgi:glyoxylase-like metal-dependent hydrolase (beta-lactamase superfamily II)
MVREQLQKYDLKLLDGAGEFQPGLRYMPAPGHTPGCYALLLDTPDRGRIDMACDTTERAAATIRTLLPLSDRRIPGHFVEMRREDGAFT